MLRDRLGEYYARSGLAFVVAVISLAEIHGAGAQQYLWNLCQSDKIVCGGAWAFDRTVLGLQCWYEKTRPPSRPDPFHKYLARFLEDSSRCHQYALTSEIYAEAALYLYRSIYRGQLFDIHGDNQFFFTCTLLNTLEWLFDHASKSQKLLHKNTGHHASFMRAIEHLYAHDRKYKNDDSEEDNDSKDDKKLLEDMIANWDQVVVPGLNKKRALYIIAKYIMSVESQ